MDPLTLFALANGAVSAVKAGCKLYKDIKGAAGDISEVLHDLDQQFHKRYEGRTPPPEAKRQLIEEKERVRELNRRSNDTTSIYTEIGEHLGTYYDNYYKCLAVFEEEEKRSKNEVYTGEASLGKRALQRVLMKKQLEAMGTELREIMVYQSPPELGALWTDVEEMMKSMGKEQKVLVARQMQRDAVLAKQRKIIRDKRIHRAMWIGAVFFVIAIYMGVMLLLVENRKKEYPELGQDFFPHRVPEYREIIIKRNQEYWERRRQEYEQRRQIIP